LARELLKLFKPDEEANILAGANIASQMAKDSEIDREFSRPVAAVVQFPLARRGIAEFDGRASDVNGHAIDG